jgi:hypothetical protein
MVSHKANILPDSLAFLIRSPVGGDNLAGMNDGVCRFHCVGLGRHLENDCKNSEDIYVFAHGYPSLLAVLCLWFICCAA